MIKREAYMKRIRPFMNNDLIKVLTGIRRSGKSVMLELIKEELLDSGVESNQFISINFEDMRYSNLHTANALHEEILKRIDDYRELYDFDEIIPVSALTKNNIDDLINTLKKYLPDNIKYYGENSVTNKSIEFLMAEIVREKVFEYTDATLS